MHHPKLFNYTKLGSIAAKQTTLGKTGTLSLQTGGSCVEKNIQATNHWVSTYRGVTSEST